MNTKNEKLTLTDEDFRNNVTVKFGGKTCEIEKANIAYEWHGTNDIGFRIIGRIPKVPSLEDMINKAAENMKKNNEMVHDTLDKLVLISSKTPRQTPLKFIGKARIFLTLSPPKF